VERVSPSTNFAATDVFGVLARSIPARLIQISRSGCLLESSRPVEDGVIGELRLQAGAQLLTDDVRVTRCVRVEGSGSSYLIGAEFVQTRHPGERSIRLAVAGLLRGRTHGGLGSINAVSTGDEVMKNLLARFVREDEGQDLIEYGLLVGLITTALVTAITLVGTQVVDYFNDLNDALPDAD
jgi:pilus assembly protein Flp/PilA